MMETTENNSEYTFAEQIAQVAAKKQALRTELNELQQSREQDSITKE